MTTKRDACPDCDGQGEIDLEVPCSPSEATGGLSAITGSQPCPTCNPMPPEPVTRPSAPAWREELVRRATERACEGCEGEIDQACAGKESDAPLERYCDPCLISSLLAELARLEGENAQFRLSRDIWKSGGEWAEKAIARLQAEVQRLTRERQQMIHELQQIEMKALAAAVMGSTDYNRELKEIADWANSAAREASGGQP